LPGCVRLDSSTQLGVNLVRIVNPARISVGDAFRYGGTDLFKLIRFQIVIDEVEFQYHLDGFAFGPEITRRDLLTQPGDKLGGEVEYQSFGRIHGQSPPGNIGDFAGIDDRLKTD
jgi:hypothetical protein